MDAPTPFAFADADFERIAAALGSAAEHEGAVVRFSLHHAASGRKLAVEISPSVALPGIAAGTTALVSAYGPLAYVQLHGVTGYLASEELGEVIFFARWGGEGGVASGLVIEREAGCSLYANVAEAMLRTDFTQLPPEAMMAAVALSMSETLFEDGAIGDME